MNALLIGTPASQHPNKTSLLAVEYVKAEISGRLMIEAMGHVAHTELLATPDIAAINRPVTA